MAKQKEPEQAPEEGAEVPKKSKGKLFLLLGVGLLALLLSIGGVLYFVFSGDDEPVSSEPATPVQLPAIYQPMEPAFVVNYTHAGRQRYMQISVVLMGRDPQKMQDMTQHFPLIRNQLVMLFSGEDFEELLTAEGKETLRERATLAVQSMLEREMSDPVIEAVLFTNMVMQ
ncbi:flagellar basal body-associated FliL family protein [Halopseudomonas salegens]|uniref:Flagellar protein FliL n=1 Tax=Halopseudomonas salegens TaxID=1434072 RepID=A0A1H2EMS7_9GAMM|nr:flagellar basal body-associated FliL family protein [Halopseudomonas salegens]SDT96426.1 flagellar FliL protein [Halopseudomonas salegens]